MFWTLHQISDRLAISSSLILGALILSLEPYFFVLPQLLHWRGRAVVIHQGGATRLIALLCCMSGRGHWGNNAACLALVLLSVTFLTFHKQILSFQVLPLSGGGLVYILGSCGPLQWTLLWDWECLPPLRPPLIFTARGFEALVSHVGTLCCSVCLAPQFLPGYLHANVGLASPPATTLPTLVHQLLFCCASSLLWLPVSTIPTSLNECFFISLVVRLPYSLISWQFWLFLFLNWLLPFFWLFEYAKHYVRKSPSWLEL